jgi:hypothetical protein
MAFEALLAVGVNVAEYVEPLPEKLLSAPPDTVISPKTKSETGSLITKLIVAVCPIVRMDRLLVIEMFGGDVSVGPPSPPHPLSKTENAQTRGSNGLIMVEWFAGRDVSMDALQ